MAEIIEQYNLKKLGWTRFELLGKILKYFSSCADYHCEKILRNVIRIMESAERNLKNAPILWIVDTLKNGINENIDLMLNDGLSTFKFDFEEHVSIYWRHTQYYLSNDDGDGLLDKFYLEREEEIGVVLKEFQNQWNINYYRRDNDDYSINFKSYKQYNNFQKYARELAKSHYIFEGDVLDILKTVIYMGIWLK